ncbi:MAG: hypothetical protein ACKOAB_04600, partial [Polynucleobacter victoriensis]
HVGYTDYKDEAATVGKISYSDYNVGLAYDLNGYVFGVKYFWNNLSAGTKGWADASGSSYGSGPKNVGKDGVAVSLTKAF